MNESMVVQPAILQPETETEIINPSFVMETELHALDEVLPPRPRRTRRGFLNKILRTSFVMGVAASASAYTTHADGVSARVIAGTPTCADSGEPGRLAVINGTIVDPDGEGFANVDNDAAIFGHESTHNYKAGQTIASLTISKIGSSGLSCITANRAANEILDLEGTLDPTVVPLDARNMPSRRVTDLRNASDLTHGKKLEIGQILPIQVGHPNDWLVATATAIDPEGKGFLNVFPCSAPPLENSVLNFRIGETTPNLTVTKIGPDGNVCVTASQRTSLALDARIFISGDKIHPLNPDGRAKRIYDSRVPEPVTGNQAIMIGGVSKCIDAGKPGDVAIINTTVIDPTATGFANMHPKSAAYDSSSVLNYAPGDQRANLTMTIIGPDGKVCYTSNTTTHVALDEVGTIEGQYFTPALSTGAKRIADTRSVVTPTTPFEPTDSKPCPPGSHLYPNSWLDSNLNGKKTGVNTRALQMPK